MIKPNLVDNNIPYPATTPVACVEALIDYARLVSGTEVIVAEGSGGFKSTTKIFRILGYLELAKEKQVRLVGSE